MGQEGLGESFEMYLHTKAVISQQTLIGSLVRPIAKCFGLQLMTGDNLCSYVMFKI